MTLLSASPLSGFEGDECFPGEVPIALEFKIEFDRFCPSCLRETRFVAAEMGLTNGLYAECTRCGDDRVIEYSRMLSS